MIADLCERFGIGGPAARRPRCAPARAIATSSIRRSGRSPPTCCRHSSKQGLAESDLAGSTRLRLRRSRPGRVRIAAGARLRSAARTRALLDRERNPRDRDRARGLRAARDARTFDLGASVRYAAQRHLRRAAFARAARNGVTNEIALARGRRDRPRRGWTRVRRRDPYAAVFVQRSRGYAPRRSLSIAHCERAIVAIADGRIQPSRFSSTTVTASWSKPREPTHVGADLAIGSLIKNLGGSLAPAGGYVVGRADLVERIAARLVRAGNSALARADARLRRAFRAGAVPRRR